MKVNDPKEKAIATTTKDARLKSKLDDAQKKFKSLKNLIKVYRAAFKRGLDEH